MILYGSKSYDVKIVENQVPVVTRNNKFLIFKGLMFAALSGLFYSLAAVLVKEMKNMPPSQLNAYRFIAIFTFSIPEAITSCENLLGPKELRFLFIIRGMCGATQSFLSYIAFRYLPLGEASVILFSIPACITVTAWIIYKEPCGLLQFITVTFTITGIFFTAKIPSYLSSNPVVYSKETIYGILAALGALFFNTCQIVILRKLKHCHHAVITFNLGWVAVIETVLLTTVIGDFRWNTCGLQSFYSVLIGIFSYIAQVCVTLAFQSELMGAVSTVRAGADIVSSFLWQTFFFNEKPDVLSIVGAILVGCSFIFVGMNKWADNLSLNSPFLKYFKWILR